MNINNIICQENNDNENEKFFFYKWKEFKIKKNIYILNYKFENKIIYYLNI